MGQHIHVSCKVWPLIHNPGTPLHTDGIATAQISVEIQAVPVGLIAAPLEILAFVKGDLEHKQSTEETYSHQACHCWAELGFSSVLLMMQL